MMVKFLKYSIYTIITLILLLIIGIIILVNVINPNRFKEPIQSEISQALNRDTHIAGDISWRFFPSLAIKVQQVEIDNPDGFENDTFASIGEIAFRVEVLPLLRKQINISNIGLDEMNINVEFNQEGQSNLDGIGESDSADDAVTTEGNNSDETLPINGLRIENVSISDSFIHYIDQESNFSLQIEDINFQSRGIETNLAFPIRLNFKFSGEEDGNEFVSGNARLNGRFQVDLDQLISSSFESMADILDPITFDGQLIITPLEFSGLNIDDVNAELQIADRQIQVNPVTAHLYQGMSTSNILMDFTNTIPQYTFDESLENIQASDFFTDLIGTSRITGRADFTMNVTASGKDSTEIIRSLNGSGSYSFTNGNLEGVNIPQIIDTATALFNNRQTPETDRNNNRTEFGQLTGTFNIVDGIIHNEDMQMESPYLQANGTGAINLNNDQINYRVQAKIPNLGERTAVQKVQESLGGSIPLLVSGTFENMVVAPDIETILNSRARSFINDQLNNLIGNDGDNEDEGSSIANQINNLLGNGNNNSESEEAENRNDNITIEQAANRFLGRLLQ